MPHKVSWLYIPQDIADEEYQGKLEGYLDTEAFRGQVIISVQQLPNAVSGEHVYLIVSRTKRRKE